MWGVLDNIIIIPIIGAFIYGFIRQIQETIILMKSSDGKNRIVRKNIISSISYGVFLMAFILNIIIGFTKLTDKILISEYTSVLCTLSLAIFFISKYSTIGKK